MDFYLFSAKKRLKMIFDTHIHLARLPHFEELTQNLERSGYAFINIACEPWEWEIAKQHPQWKCSYGIHPMIAAKLTDEDFAVLRSLLEQHPDAQVGEAGLDKRFDGYEPGGIQEATFEKQVHLAIELGRDIQIHCVGDYGRIIRILKDAGLGQQTSISPIFHRFGGDAGIVKAGLQLNAKFSIHRDSFRKKATAEALKNIPPERLLFETDADESFFENRNFTSVSEACVMLIKEWAFVRELALG